MAQDEMTVAARSANARDFTAAQAALARATPHLDQGLTSWRGSGQASGRSGRLVADRGEVREVREAEVQARDLEEAAPAPVQVAVERAMGAIKNVGGLCHLHY